MTTPDLEREVPIVPTAEQREYEPFDPDYCRELVRRVLGPIGDQYFRPLLIGADRIPTTGPVILAANHSGTAFPYDAITLDFTLWRRDRMLPAAKFRSVFEKELALAWWMRPFGIDNFWRRGGAVDMTFDNFERLLQRGDRVLYYPEGVPGIGKGFNRRYQLQRFRTSFMLLAARHDVPIYPVSVVNAEWVMPFHVTYPPLDRLMRRFFHVPFLPLPAGVLAAVIPWMWYLALPAHMTFVVGEPFDARRMLKREGIREYDRPDRAALERATRFARHEMQARLDENVARYGTRPYDWRSLIRALRANGGSVARALPTGWPLSFIGFDRDYQRPRARNRWHAVLRDLDLFAFYLPLGWPLLSLSRMLRRPPHGYRGLTKSERDERQGSFIWKLTERPLPRRRPSASAPRVVTARDQERELPRAPART